MIEGQFAIAFTLGLLAVVNPCGFAMLPAYLSFFLGIEGRSTDTRADLSRAIAVSLSVSAGFVATFAVITAVIRNVTNDVLEWSPWVSIGIGLAMAGLGAAVLLGKELTINLPRLDRGGTDGSVAQMALYGISYAVVSLGCTIPTFMAYLLTAIRGESWLSGVATVVAFGAGFTLLLTSLAIGVALARQGLLRSMRGLLPYVQRIAGGILLLTGLYVAWYGRYELLGTTDDPAVDRVDDWSNLVARWVNNTGALPLGLVLAVIVAAAAIMVATRRRSAT